MTHAPEQLARQEIDRQLAECGWLVQDHVDEHHRRAGVAVQEFPFESG